MPAWLIDANTQKACIGLIGAFSLLSYAIAILSNKAYFAMSRLWALARTPTSILQDWLIPRDAHGVVTPTKPRST